MGMSISNSFLGLNSGMGLRRVNPSDPVGEVFSTEGMLTEGVASESKNYDPYSSRHNFWRACLLLRTSYEEFGNKCKKSEEDKKAGEKSHSSFTMVA